MAQAFCLANYSSHASLRVNSLQSQPIWHDVCIHICQESICCTPSKRSLSGTNCMSLEWYPGNRQMCEVNECMSCLLWLFRAQSRTTGGPRHARSRRCSSGRKLHMSTAPTRRRPLTMATWQMGTAQMVECPARVILRKTRMCVPSFCNESPWPAPAVNALEVCSGAPCQWRVHSHASFVTRLAATQHCHAHRVMTAYHPGLLQGPSRWGSHDSALLVAFHMLRVNQDFVGAAWQLTVLGCCL